MAKYLWRGASSLFGVLQDVALHEVARDMTDISLDALWLCGDDLLDLPDLVLNGGHALVHDLQRPLHEFHGPHCLFVVDC